MNIKQNFQNFKTKVIYTNILISACLSFGNTAYAAGFQLFETGAMGLGYSYAGNGVSNEDISILYNNPAGMVLLGRQSLQVTLHQVASSFKFENYGSTNALTDSPLSGENDDGGGSSTIPNLYYNTKFGNYHFGIAINAPFGSTTKYADNWVGRYHATESGIKLINYNFALAYKVNNSLSIGGGLNYQVINVILASAIDFNSISLLASNGLLTSSDGAVELTGSNAGFGYNFGLLKEIDSNKIGISRIGISYRSAIKHNVSGKADFTRPSDLSALVNSSLDSSNIFVDTNITAEAIIPAQLLISYMQTISDKTKLYADINFTNWSTFEKLVIDYDSEQADTVNTYKWQDTLRVAIGIGYELNPKTQLRFGYASDESAISQTNLRSPRVPDNHRSWYSFGVGYKVTNSIVLDFGYAYLDIPNSKSELEFETSTAQLKHLLQGKYTASASIFAIQIQKKF